MVMEIVISDDIINDTKSKLLPLQEQLLDLKKNIGSMYFEPRNITKILVDFLNRKYEGTYVFNLITHGNSYEGVSVEYYILKKGDSDFWCVFKTPELFDNYDNLVGFDHILSKFNNMDSFIRYLAHTTYLLDYEECVWNSHRVRIYNCSFADSDEYQEVNAFIEYLSIRQFQNNGKRLDYYEMQKALNDFLSEEKDKPKQKIKENK